MSIESITPCVFLNHSNTSVLKIRRNFVHFVTGIIGKHGTLSVYLTIVSMRDLSSEIG